MVDYASMLGPLDLVVRSNTVLLFRLSGGEFSSHRFKVAEKTSRSVRPYSVIFGPLSAGRPPR